MMADWEFKYSFYTEANKMDAWNYWTDLDNHARMEPGVERIELDGPFITGTSGRTITKEYTQEWILTAVEEGTSWTLTGYTPDGRGMLSFTWKFEQEGSGTRMTQHIMANGHLLEQYPEELHQIEDNAPEAM